MTGTWNFRGGGTIPLVRYIRVNFTWESILVRDASGSGAEHQREADRPLGVRRYVMSEASLRRAEARLRKLRPCSVWYDGMLAGALRFSTAPRAGRPAGVAKMLSAWLSAASGWRAGHGHLQVVAAPRVVRTPDGRELSRGQVARPL